MALTENKTGKPGCVCVSTKQSAIGSTELKLLSMSVKPSGNHALFTELSP